MTHPTCAVRCAIRDQAGTPAAGAEITAILNRAEVHDGYLIPVRVSAVADSAGIAVLPLWPNVLGATESVYQVLIKHPGGAVLRTTAVVPDLAEIDLHLIAELPAYPGRTNGQLLIDYAITASRETLQQIHEIQVEVDKAVADAAAAATAASTSAAAADLAVEDMQSALTRIATDLIRTQTIVTEHHAFS